MGGQEPDDSNKVYGIPGVSEYPMPITPEYIRDWKAWDKSDAGKAYKRADAEYKKAQKAYDAKVVKDKAAAKKQKVEYDPRDLRHRAGQAGEQRAGVPGGQAPAA